MSLYVTFGEVIGFIRLVMLSIILGSSTVSDKMEHGFEIEAILPWCSNESVR